MDEFTRQGLTDKQMRDANKCCIYLQAFYTLDITYLTGKAIEDWEKQGKRQAHRTSKCKWPVQQTLTAAALFGVCYHSLLVSTKNEHILLLGGGPDDGSPLYITSYRSELGGICAGLAVIGVFARFG
jgi:hypothetical protein